MSPYLRFGRTSETYSLRTSWICWRPAARYVATPVSVVPRSTSWGTHYAILYVEPGPPVLLRPLQARAHSRFPLMAARRMAALRAAIRRLAMRAAIIRTSGVN